MAELGYAEASAHKTAREIWPNAGLSGELAQELPTPAHFRQATRLVTEDMIAELVVCGSDATRHIEKIQEFVDAGFDHVYIHQVGTDQQGVLDFYRREIMPRFR